MKQKILFLVTLVLLAVQGWASVIIEPNNLTFPSQTVGTSYSLTFTVNDYVIVSGENPDIEGSSSITSVELKDPNGVFSYEKVSSNTSHFTTIIRYSDGGKKYTTQITYTTKWKVYYRPSYAGTHIAKIVFNYKEPTIFFTYKNKTKEVLLQGTAVEPTITVTPQNYAFGTVVKGKKSDPKTFTVTGTNTTGNLTVSSSSTYFKVTPASLPASGGKVTVTYEPTAAGSHSGTITVSGNGTSAKISVTGTCTNPPTPKITVTPENYAFGTVVKGKKSDPKTFTVTGTNTTGSLTVSSSIPSIFKVTPASLPASGGKVTVTYEPTAVGSHSGTITVSGGGADPKTVSVSGTCVKPTITVSSTSLSFGTVPYDSNVSNAPTKKFTVTGRNLTGNLTVSSSSSMFTVSPTSITRNSDGTVSQTVTVKFLTYKPGAVGSQTATITVSGGGADPKTVSVSGTCVKPTITVSSTSLSFGTVPYDSNVSNAPTKKFTVTGRNLTGNLTVSSSSSMFTVSPTSITRNSDGTVSQTVTVKFLTYKPGAVGSQTAIITVSGGGADPKTVSVTGTCVNPSTPKITTNVSSLHFSAAVSKTFKVTGTNLTGSLTVRSNNTKFTVSPSTISASDAAAGKYVTVTYHDTDGASNAIGIITISGGGASSKKVSVTYAKGIDPQAPLVNPKDAGDDSNDEFSKVSLQEAFGNPISDIDELAMNSRIYADGHSIIIESPVGQEAIISDISGRAQRVNLQAGRNEIPVNASGVYIVRIREKTAKLMIK